ncbi:MAG: T9SS type A sorting domain-containing protein, partial [Saprospiraceae bacterium]
LINNMTGVLESHNWVLKLDSLGCLQPGCGEINYITGIEEAVFLKGKDILFYPNPSNGYLNVKFPSDFALGKDVLLDLVSASGGFIKRVKISSLDARIDLSALLPGFYFAIISQGNEIIASKKIMVGR